MGSAKNESIYYSLDKGPLEDEDSAILKTVKAATSGLVAGTIWGTVVATWYDVPRVERHVALPGLIRTLKICGNYGLTFAAIGGIYIGVEQLVLKQRVKKDFINGAVGAFVAGASVYGLKGNLLPQTGFLFPHKILNASYFQVSLLYFYTLSNFIANMKRIYLIGFYLY